MQKDLKLEQSQKGSIWGCFGCLGIILASLLGIGLFIVGPILFKEWLFNEEGSIAFSFQYVVTILVTVGAVIPIFICLQFVNKLKTFLLVMTVPFLAWILLFFNFYLVTMDGVKISPYLQVIPKFVEWEDMKEVGFFPSYRTGRRDTTFELKMAITEGGKTHWIELDYDMEKLETLKEKLANQGDVPVFIHALDKKDVERLEDLKKEDPKYYREVIKFLEVKDMEKNKDGYILVNESFYE